MDKKIKPGCLVEFPNGKILSIICETPNGLLFEIENKEVELLAGNYHKCKFLGDPKQMKVTQRTIF